MSFTSPRMQSLFELKRPQSVAIYDTYADAQRAVDYLADAKFPVENLAIVGTDLKSIERVTGELTWGRVLMNGAVQGIMWGLMAGMLLYFMDPTRGIAQSMGYGLAIGMAAGALSASISYAMGRGRKDFSSMTQTVATHYEILGEAEVAPQARRLLGGGAPEQSSPESLERGLDKTSRAAGATPPVKLPPPDLPPPTHRPQAGAPERSEPSARPQQPEQANQPERPQSVEQPQSPRPAARPDPNAKPEPGDTPEGRPDFV